VKPAKLMMIWNRFYIARNSNICHQTAKSTQKDF